MPFLSTKQVKLDVKIPKGYRRLRVGEVIPNNYLGYFKQLNPIFGRRLMTPRQIGKEYGINWVSERILDSDWTPFFVPK